MYLSVCVCVCVSLYIFQLPLWLVVYLVIHLPSPLAQWYWLLLKHMRTHTHTHTQQQNNHAPHTHARTHTHTHTRAYMCDIHFIFKLGCVQYINRTHTDTLMQVLTQGAPIALWFIHTHSRSVWMRAKNRNTQTHTPTSAQNIEHERLNNAVTVPLIVLSGHSNSTVTVCVWMRTSLCLCALG